MSLLRPITSTRALLALVLACVCGDVPSSVQALTLVSASVDIGAAVDIRCSVIANPLHFGVYVPSGAHATTPLDATTTINLDCIGGRRADVRLDQGVDPDPSSTDNAPLRRLSDGGGNYLDYNLYEDSGYATVWDNRPRAVLAPRTFPTLLTVYGRIPPAQNVFRGLYTDTVIVSVYY